MRKMGKDWLVPTLKENQQILGDINKPILSHASPVCACACVCVCQDVCTAVCTPDPACACACDCEGDD